MTKTRLEKIADYDEKIAQIKNLQKQELQKHHKEERAARTRRLCSRHGLLEKMLPEIITITDEQYQTFLEKAVTNEYGRGILNKIITQNTAAAPPTTAGSAGSAAQTVTTTAPAKPTATAQENAEDESEDGGNGARVKG